MNGATTRRVASAQPARIAPVLAHNSPRTARLDEPEGDDLLGGRRPPTAGEGRCGMASEDRAPDKDLHLIGEALLQERPNDRAASFHEERRHPSSGQILQ